MRGELQAERRALGLPVPDDSEGDRDSLGVAATSICHRTQRSPSFARTDLRRRALWGADLSAVRGFADAVAEHLVRIVRQGVDAALDVSPHRTGNELT